MQGSYHHHEERAGPSCPELSRALCDLAAREYRQPAPWSDYFPDENAALSPDWDDVLEDMIIAADRAGAVAVGAQRRSLADRFAAACRAELARGSQGVGAGGSGGAGGSPSASSSADRQAPASRVQLAAAGPAGGAGDGGAAAGGAPGQRHPPAPAQDTAQWELHETGNCRPCNFVSRGKGCRNGAACQFCHLPHNKPPKKARQSRLAHQQGVAEAESHGSSQQLGAWAQLDQEAERRQDVCRPARQWEYQ